MSALKRNGAFLSPSPQTASFSLHQHLWNINQTSSLLKSVKTYASYRASLTAHLVKNWPAMQETLVWSLGQEDLLEKGQGTHSTILGLPLVAQLVKNPLAMQETWVNPWVGKTPGEGKSYALQYSGLENSTACIVHGVTESDTTEQLSLSLTFMPPTVHSPCKIRISYKQYVNVTMPFPYLNPCNDSHLEWN